MNTITAFLRDLKASSGNKYGANLLDQMIAESEKPAITNTWVTATPANDDYKADIAGLGVFVDFYTSGGQVNRPTCIRLVGGEYWIASYNTRIARYDINGSFLGYWIGKYAAPTTNDDSYANSNSFVADEVNDRLFIIMPYYVRAFTLSTGDLLWSFGTGASGNLIDNAIYTGTDVDLLPNGNIVVCSQNGKGVISGVEGIGHGHIDEFNAETGALIACRIMYAPDTKGEAWQQSCYRPYACRVLNNRLYVSMNSGDHVGVFDVDTFQYIESFTKPRGLDVGSIGATGVALNATNDELVVAANSPKRLVGLGLSDHDIHWYSGQQRWDDRAASSKKIGDFQDIRHVLNIGSGRYMVADYGNHRVMVVGESTQLTVQYSVTIPAGFEIKRCPDCFDKETHVVTVDIRDADKLQDVDLLLAPIV